MPECTFCGRREDQVRLLLRGPEVQICDRCVGVCNRLLQEAGVPIPMDFAGAAAARRRRSWLERLGLTSASRAARSAGR